MDQVVLVKNDRDIGAQVLNALSRARIPISLCEWQYVPQLQEWQLTIATPWYDAKGPRTTYRAFVDAFETAGIYQDVPMRRLFIRSPRDPLVQALQQEIREQKEGFIHILKHSGPSNGTQYSILFAPISGPGGAVPARRFSTLEDLRRFLTEDLHVRPLSVEDAFDEMKRTGAGSIHPVSLTARQLKKLGLD